MKSSPVVRHSTLYVSDVRPDVTSERESDAELLVWADANPEVYKIVDGARSAPFGWKSCDYMGWMRAKGETLERVRHFRAQLTWDAVNRPPPTPDGDETESIFQWRAKFTLAHHANSAMRGGLFHQWDGEYNRGCLALDYTPDTLSEVIVRFRAWCERPGMHAGTKAVTIGKKLVWGAK